MKEFEKSFQGRLSCYSVNARGKFVRSYSSLEEAKKGAMYWLKVWGGIDSENVIPYGTIRSDTSEIHKREVHEAKLYMTFITRYADIIEIIKNMIIREMQQMKWQRYSASTEMRLDLYTVCLIRYCFQLRDLRQ